MDVDDDGNKYTDITSVNTSHTDAVAGSQAERDVYYSDKVSAGAVNSSYDNGGGYYVHYKYYLKSSSTTDLSISANKLLVNVTATKNAGSSDNLDKALRVGVKIDSYSLIFAPLGGQTSYNVTSNIAGDATTAVTAVNSKTGINTSAITIPKTTSPGKLVDVYLWYEGEYKDCISDNLTEVLADYEIKITFEDGDLTVSG